MSAPETTTCPNCGAASTGNYCAGCGQRDQPLRQGVGQFLRQAFNEFFGLDGRLWVTLRLLIFKPGQLTVEYIEGRRKRYIAPIRLYLSATVFFFFLISVLDPVESVQRQIGGANRDSTMTVSDRMEEIAGDLARQENRIRDARDATLVAEGRLDSLLATSEGVVLDSVALGVFDLNLTQFREDAEESEERLAERVRESAIDRNRLDWQQSVLETYPPDSLIRPIDLRDAAALLFPSNGGLSIDVFGTQGPRNSALNQLKNARTASERRDALGALFRSAIDRVPVALFFMLPVFALMLKLLYIRRRWYFSEHLVFGLHNHAVTFLGLAVVAILAAAGMNTNWVSVLSTAIVLSLNVYYFLALKRVYRQGVFKSLFKFALLWVWYWTFVTFFGTIVVLILAAVLG